VPYPRRCASVERGCALGYVGKSGVASTPILKLLPAQEALVGAKRTEPIIVTIPHEDPTLIADLIDPPLAETGMERIYLSFRPTR